MKTAILDTNVILDFIKVREFHHEAARILDLASMRAFKAHFSAHQVTTIAYYLKKTYGSSAEFRRELSELLEYIRSFPVDQDILDSALCSPIDDYEDAVLEAVAQKHGVDYIVTRNTKDFLRSRVKVLTPAQFIKGLGAPEQESDENGMIVREPAPSYRTRPRRRRITVAS